ncbi:MAG: hypothetical protein ACI9JN_002413 [Bacteroidia bacterium]|jgi:hypothetical protein
MRASFFLITFMVLYNVGQCQYKTIQAPGEFTYSTAFSFGFLSNFANDQDRDGVIDRTQTTSYDSALRVIWITRDNDGDGNIDYIEKQEYNINHLLIRVEINDDGLGLLETVYVYEYDTSFRKTKELIDLDADGFWNVKYENVYMTDSTLRWYYRDKNDNGTFDESSLTVSAIDGRRLSHKKDKDLNGKWDHIESYQYNSMGQQTWYGDDANGNGTFERNDYWVYNKKGLITFNSYDRNGNGIPDYQFWYSYDSLDRELEYYEESSLGETSTRSYKYDVYGNTIEYVAEKSDITLYYKVIGIISDSNRVRKWDTYTDRSSTPSKYTIDKYDTRGNKVWNEDGEQDSSGKLKRRRLWVYEFDHIDNKISEWRDMNGDSNYEVNYNYTYDAIWNYKTRYEIDSSADGTVDEIWYATLNSKGHGKSFWKDIGNDGDTNYIQYFYYDNEDRWVLVETDNDANGVIDSRQSNEYDEFGHQLKTAYDYDGDSIFEQHTLRIYDVNGNVTYSEELRNGSTTVRISNNEFDNYTRCPLIRDGLIHKLIVEIPESGAWRFSLCGSQTANMKMVLSQNNFCQDDQKSSKFTCTDGNDEMDVNLDAGQYYLTLGGAGFNDNGLYNLTIKRTGNVSISPSTHRNKQVRVYPNPTNNSLIIPVKYDYFEVISFQGNFVIKGDYANELDVSNLATGVYVLKLLFGDEVYYSRFIKE